VTAPTGSLPPVKLRSIVSLLAVFLVAVLAGCGEKSEPETTGPLVTTGSTTPQKQPEPTTTTTTGGGGGESPDALARRAIERFLTAGDPVVCEQLLTARLVRMAYGDLKGCEAAQRPASAAKSVRISALTVRGAKATATAIPRGGASNGEKLRIGLVGQGDAWLIDSLRSNAPVGP